MNITNLLGSFSDEFDDHRAIANIGNKPVEAIQMYERALLYDPNYIEAKDALAKLGVKQ